MWYRRTFTVPADWHIGSGRRLLLNFGAVDWQSEVYVNGVRVAEHRGGYDKFGVDVTDALKPGRSQELIVGVYDPTDAASGENPPLGKQRLDPSGIWYTPTSGIWQTVWMEPVAPDHVDSLKLTPDVAGGRLTVEPKGVRDGLPVTATAYEGGRKVATVTGRTGQPLTLKIAHPRLWSPDDPFLYDLRVSVGHDRVGSYFGMRSISVEKVDGTPRTVLNGKPVFMMATLDQGFWPDGLYTAPTDEALAYDLRMHKEMGFNAVRKHIKVEPDRWFYWADRLGLLVWQDMPAMTAGVNPSAAARVEYEREMKLMIDQHISSPSVVMWVTFNEGWGQYDEGRIADQAKSWDPTRLVNGMSGLNLGPTAAPATSWTNTAIRAPRCHRLPTADARSSAASTGPGTRRARARLVGPAVVRGRGPVDVHRRLPRPPRRGTGTRVPGSNGAVYTQISDVEGELNGLLTYDRKVVKPDVGRLRAAHEALIADASRATPRAARQPDASGPSRAFAVLGRPGASGPSRGRASARVPRSGRLS